MWLGLIFGGIMFTMIFCFAFIKPKEDDEIFTIDDLLGIIIFDFFLVLGSFFYYLISNKLEEIKFSCSDFLLVVALFVLWFLASIMSDFASNHNMETKEKKCCYIVVLIFVVLTGLALRFVFKDRNGIPFMSKTLAVLFSTYIPIDLFFYKKETRDKIMAKIKGLKIKGLKGLGKRVMKGVSLRKFAIILVLNFFLFGGAILHVLLDNDESLFLKGLDIAFGICVVAAVGYVIYIHKRNKKQLQQSNDNNSNK